MDKSKVYIVGVGPGSPDWVSRRVRELVISADILVGWEQDFRPVASLVRNQRIFLQECHNYLEIPDQAAIQATKNGSTVVVLKTGDPLVAPAGLNELLSTFDGFDVQVVPGISSVQLAAAKAKISLADSAIITYHPLPRDGGRDLRLKRKRMVQALSNGLNLIILSGVRQMPSLTARFLLAQEVKPTSRVTVFENLTLEDEHVTQTSLGTVAGMKFNWLSVMVVYNEGSIWE
ncbi:iron complex transport system substrate-binding protein [Dehalogenimonas formicexedens]|uniref:Iron complex transport system substrate-binding protein n=2 Tax=Dehalogenimonas TaxID=670486 RepID=A0A1P8FA21_9CHLR|nr:MULTISPECIES: precorrin-6y C5,15-methyltransferase (decarboxylating) subunit CbiE [Dehalogenimonas]APV45293.1 iron complex transport system substrate-binding protein [Dehalogenimonas formicexedens]KTB49098.1 precorrin-6Y C5,15-methyltransferase (decarboxylating) [Dehalogenimonas alkenigignens]